VSNAWLVDPIERTLEVFHLAYGLRSLVATSSADERVRAEPFDAVELDLTILRADVEPLATK
jgi:hypothetical protein